MKVFLKISIIRMQRRFSEETIDWRYDRNSLYSSLSFNRSVTSRWISPALRSLWVRISTVRSNSGGGTSDAGRGGGGVKNGEEKKVKRGRTRRLRTRVAVRVGD